MSGKFAKFPCSKFAKPCTHCFRMQVAPGQLPSKHRAIFHSLEPMGSWAEAFPMFHPFSIDNIFYQQRDKPEKSPPKKPALALLVTTFAEGAGFEPALSFLSTVLETAGIGHSPNLG